MSKHALKKTLKKELDVLNWKIDMKIIKGEPYRQEARRHKFLLAQFQYLTRQAEATSNWLEKATHVFTNFAL